MILQDVELPMDCRVAIVSIEKCSCYPQDLRLRRRDAAREIDVQGDGLRKRLPAAASLTARTRSLSGPPLRT